MKNEYVPGSSRRGDRKLARGMLSQGASMKVQGEMMMEQAQEIYPKDVNWKKIIIIPFYVARDQYGGEVFVKGLVHLGGMLGIIALGGFLNTQFKTEVGLQCMALPAVAYGFSGLVSVVSAYRK